MIFIDKPFVSKRLNQRNKNEKFYKRSLMVTLVKNQITNRSIKMRQQTTASNEIKSETIDVSSTQNYQLDYEAENKLVNKQTK